MIMIFACSAAEKPSPTPHHAVKKALQKISAAQSKRFAPLRKSVREIAKNDLDMLIDIFKNVSEKIEKNEEEIN